MGKYRFYNVKGDKYHKPFPRSPSGTNTVQIVCYFKVDLEKVMSNARSNKMYLTDNYETSNPFKNCRVIYEDIGKVEKA